MARIDAAWNDFWLKGQTWDDFWQGTLPAGSNVVVLPDAAAVTLTGATPVVLAPALSLPTAVSLTLTGAVPIVTVTRRGDGQRIHPAPFPRPYEWPAPLPDDDDLMLWLT